MKNLALELQSMLSDAWIMVAPIYFSGLPSSMIALMDVLGSEKYRRRDLKVAASCSAASMKKPIPNELWN
jgi:multimeric flavodoxin WrbA